jgi:hypothetical protein
MLSSGMKCYHLELMLPSVTTCYHMGLHVIIWDALLSSGANVIIWDKMLSSGANVIIVSSGANVIIWCYHVMLLSGMITHPFFIFPENFTHSIIHFRTFPNEVSKIRLFLFEKVKIIIIPHGSSFLGTYKQKGEKLKI